MKFDDVHSLFERCLDLAERAPPEHQEAMLAIARDLLTLARQCIGPITDDKQTAPTSLRAQ
jgi:hypothetical protein